MPDPSQVQQLATGGGTYFLAFAVFTLLGGLVWAVKEIKGLYVSHKEELKEKDAARERVEDEYRKDMKEMAARYETSLEKRDVRFEAMIHKLCDRMDRVEDVVQSCPSRHPLPVVKQVTGN